MKTKVISKIKKEKIWISLFGLISVISIVRFFYALSGDYFTFLDEYPTFDVAAGFAKTGKFCFWDFHHQVLTDHSYTRAWPHTVLLGLWFHIFGINVVAGKTLSALFGVLFVLSLCYITKEIYGNYYISLLSCLFVMTNSTVVTVFRQIRMYSLWMLITLWLIYFVYRALTAKPEYSGNNSILRFWKDNFNFSAKYIVASIVLLILGYYTHVNTLAIGVGACLFFLFLLIIKRERRYVAVTVIIGIALLLTALLLQWLITVSLALGDIYWWIVTSGNVAIREDINIRYWYWLQDFVHSRRFFWAAFGCMIIAFLKNVIKKRDEKLDFSVYIFLITGSTMLCFLFLLSRYYAARYFLYIAPLVAILMAWGIVETFTIIKWKPLLLAATAVSILFVAVNVKQEYVEVYDNPKICRHRQVYEVLKADAQTEMPKDKSIAIAGYDFRDYYGVQVLDNYETAEFDRENDMEILKEFAVEHPDGYVLVESAKINGFPEVIKAFIQRYSERIAGEGIDLYNIETVRYHLLNPLRISFDIADDNVVQNGPVSYAFSTSGDETTLRINLDRSMLETKADTVFLKFGIFTAGGETADKCYQLRIPEDAKGKTLSYEAVVNSPCDVVLLKDECMIYYTDGTCREKLLYEK